HSRGDVEVEVREVALGADPAGPEREATGEFPIELLGQGDRHFLVPVAAPAEADVVEGALVRRDEGVPGGCPVPRVGICGGNGRLRRGDAAERAANIGAPGLHRKGGDAVRGRRGDPAGGRARLAVAGEQRADRRKRGGGENSGEDERAEQGSDEGNGAGGRG